MMPAELPTGVARPRGDAPCITPSSHEAHP